MSFSHFTVFNSLDGAKMGFQEFIYFNRRGAVDFAAPSMGMDGIGKIKTGSFESFEKPGAMDNVGG